MVVKSEKVFPQANDFDKFIKILHMSEEDILNKEKISKELNIHVRQVDYYKSSLKYFDLYDATTKKFTMSGQEIRNLPEHIKYKKLIKLILSDEIFFDAFYEKLFSGKKLISKELGELLYSEEKVESYKTAIRRGSTVKGWIEWICSRIRLE